MKNPSLVELNPGDVFGRLTIVSSVQRAGRTCGAIASCECGREVRISLGHLRCGVKSCGCLRKDRSAVGKAISDAKRQFSSQHGGSVDHRAEHTAWVNMVQRCHNESNPSYFRYGGRGIRVCQQWRDSFHQFLVDMGKRPSPLMTIERKDNSLGYSPENCEWASRKDQARNHRRNRLVEFNGETKCLTDWAAIVGLSNPALEYRIDKWGVEAAMTTAANGKPKGESHGNALLNDSIVRSIRELRSHGMSYPKIAQALNISKACAKQVGSGKTWKHVK